MSIIEELKDKARKIGIFDGGRLAVCDVNELHKALVSLEVLMTLAEDENQTHLPSLRVIRDYFESVMLDSEEYGETHGQTEVFRAISLSPGNNNGSS
jgi:hypothetical protein